MALGRDETEAVFNNLIGPTIAKLGFDVVRIPEVEHNELIDNMIMACLNSADIVIAELTFARPSVYYEAGYAERRIPVIYTCRRDHLSSKDDLLRVHFDMEHKPIIDWTDATDAVFCSRLEKQIKYLTGSLADYAARDLISYLKEITNSGKNPSFHFEDDIVRRMEHERIFAEFRKPTLDDKDFPEVFQKDVEILISYLHHLKNKHSAGTLTPTAFHNEVSEYSSTVSQLLDYFEECFVKARYGIRIYMTPHLKNLFDLHLEIGGFLHQRPSEKYGSLYRNVVSRIERLTSFLQE